jgi:D-alanyl-D-alanine dipeptidase
MKTPLEKIEILSIYKLRGQRVFLPDRMAKCTPDTRAAVLNIARDVREAGGSLYLSDMFRSYDMQFQAHLDYATGKKKAFSPPPGGSLHEAGRAFDLSLDDLKLELSDFWEIARTHGVSPIIDSPDPGSSESWHFDCRGSHGLVYDYYKSGKATNMSPYKAMAASCILAAGIDVDRFGPRCEAAYLQSCLVRLGHELGNIDGYVGMKTAAALREAGVETANITEALRLVEARLQEEFTSEFRLEIPGESEPFDYSEPGHMVTGAVHLHGR